MESLARWAIGPISLPLKHTLTNAPTHLSITSGIALLNADLYFPLEKKKRDTKDQVVAHAAFQCRKGYRVMGSSTLGHILDKAITVHSLLGYSKFM